MKKFSVFLVLFFVFSFSVALAGFSLKDWRYFKEIAVTREGLQKLNLDSETFSGVQKDLRDLRIIASDGTEIAYKPVVEKEQETVQFHYSIIFNNAYNPPPQVAPEGGNGVTFAVLGFQQFIVDLTESGKLHSKIKISTPEKNFQRRVEILGTSEQPNWQILRSDGYIYDYTDKRGGLKAQNTDVSYPQSTFRYLMVRIYSDALFRVSGAQVYQEEKRSAKETTFNVSFSQGADENGNSVLDLDLGQDGLPTREIILSTEQTNFDRPASVWAKNTAQEEYLRLSSDYLFKYNTVKFIGQNLTLRYPETQARFLRVIVYNGDDKPVSFTHAQVQGILRSIVFETETANTYRLFYGNEHAKRPIYDIERRFAYLDVGAASAASLSAQQLNPEYAEKLPPFTERYKFFLPGVLVFAVLALLVIIFRFVKGVSRGSSA